MDNTNSSYRDVATVVEGPKPKPVAHKSRSTRSIVKVREDIGRNDPCPCGSGKKFKHCHLKGA